MKVNVRFIPLSLVILLVSLAITAQTTEFTYQGTLQNSSAPANGNFDFEFSLFDSLTGGTQLGSTLTRSPVAIAAGTFAVNLDFGANFPGANRFLEIRVRESGGGAFTPLSPRQALNSAPYAVKAVNADSASNATTAATATNATQLGGVAAGQYVLTSDARLADARTPAAGSPNYIQNTAIQQANSNFYVSGNGTTGGTLSGRNVNSTFEYRLGGQPFLNAVSSNSSFGIDAGSPNYGSGNAYAGYRSGMFATSLASNNAFFGANAGRSNSSGTGNSFFGAQSGEINMFGESNSFFGNNAGSANTFGSSNTAVGSNANFGTENLSFATAIGAGAIASSNNSLVLGRAADTVQVPGALAITGALTASGSGLTNINAANITVGTLDAGRLGNGAILNGTTPQTSSSFNINGNGIVDGLLSGNNVNADTQYLLGGSRILGNAGTHNLFAGILAGANNSGGQNAFFGSLAGTANSSGSSNSFFGADAAKFNTSGSNNSIFGSLAGQTNTSGSNITLFGAGANVASGNLNNATAIGAGALVSTSDTLVLGRSNGADTVQIPGELNVAATINSATQYNLGGVRVFKIGTFNTFLGQEAGRDNTTGTGNTFVGHPAGAANTTGSFNSYFGSGAGEFSTGASNTFLGYQSGRVGSSGNSNTFVGAGTSGTANLSSVTLLGWAAGTLSNSITNAGAFGAQAAVTQSNSLVLGSISGVNGATFDTKVGIGTTAPAEKLHVVGNGLFTGNLTVNGTFSGNLPSGSGNYIQNATSQQAASNFNISGTGNAAIFDAATQYNIGGFRVLGTPGSGNTLVGLSAGPASLSGESNSFFGNSAGSGTSTGGNNSFFGNGAGSRNSSGADNSFFGLSAGIANTTGSNNTLFGSMANVGSVDLTNATSIGYRSFVTQSNSLVLGSINGVNGATASSNVGIGTTAPSETLHVVGNGLFTGNLTVNGTITGPVGAGSITGILGLANGGTGLSTPGTAGNFLRSTGSVWASAPLAATDIPEGSVNYIQNQNAGTQASSNFNISGNGTAGGTLSGNLVNASTQFNIGGGRVFTVDASLNNTFAGLSAGSANTLGQGNSFFGRDTGMLNTTGAANSFIGSQTGSANTVGSSNTFVGSTAGSSNTSGDNNSFFGRSAGMSNSVGNLNAYFGLSAGENSNANSNAFFGANAGLANTSGEGNAFFGSSAGSGNGAGSFNTFIGTSTGGAITTGTNNTVLGSSAFVSTGNLTFATAIGSGAVVGTSNTVVLGRSQGQDTVQVPGGLQIALLGAAGSTTLCRNSSNEVSTCSSSLRYKSNVNPFSSGLDLIRNLRPVSFNWKDGGMRDMGLVAEEVNAVEPLLTTTNASGQVEGVKYDRVGVVLVNAVNEQQTQIETQQHTIRVQQARIDALQKQVDEMKSSVAEIAALKKLVCSMVVKAAICN